MTVAEAYQALGISPGAGKNEIKKRYRKLMLQVHPDVETSARERYGYSAQEINLAYSILMKEQVCDGRADSAGKKKGASKKQEKAVWDAPVNENAFTEREVLQYAEGQDGSILGNFCAARGKYLWRTEEDFPLFLLSLYRCSKKLLDEIDGELCREAVPRKRQRIQTELTYLLAQQFIDSTALLKELAGEKAAAEGGTDVYFVASMLEFSDRTAAVKEGEALFPAGVRQHRLYVKNQAGQELGYVSFWDDRLYYVIIPLFEQKNVQVRISVAKKRAVKGRKAARRYENLDLWIKPVHADTSRMPENLNLQIEKVLGEYRER